MSVMFDPPTARPLLLHDKDAGLREPVLPVAAEECGAPAIAAA